MPWQLMRIGLVATSKATGYSHRLSQAKVTVVTAEWLINLTYSEDSMTRHFVASGYMKGFSLWFIPLDGARTVLCSLTVTL